MLNKHCLELCEKSVLPRGVLHVLVQNWHFISAELPDILFVWYKNRGTRTRDARLTVVHCKNLTPNFFFNIKLNKQFKHFQKN